MFVASIGSMITVAMGTEVSMVSVGRDTLGASPGADVTP